MQKKYEDSFEGAKKFFFDNPNVSKWSRKNKQEYQAPAKSYLILGNKVIRLENISLNSNAYLGRGMFAKVKIGISEHNKEYAVRIEGNRYSPQNMTQYFLTKLTDTLHITIRESKSQKSIGIGDLIDDKPPSVKHYSVTYKGTCITKIDKKDYLTNINRSIKIFEELEWRLANNMLHFDIKPENIILINNENKDIKITDLPDITINEVNQEKITISGKIVCSTGTIKKFIKYDPNEIKYNEILSFLYKSDKIPQKKVDLSSFDRLCLWASLTELDEKNNVFLYPLLYKTNNKTDYYVDPDIHNYLREQPFKNIFFKTPNILRAYLITLSFNIQITLENLINLCYEPNCIEAIIKNKTNKFAIINALKKYEITIYNENLLDTTNYEIKNDIISLLEQYLTSAKNYLNTHPTKMASCLFGFSKNDKIAIVEKLIRIINGSNENINNNEIKIIQQGSLGDMLRRLAKQKQHEQIWDNYKNTPDAPSKSVRGLVKILTDNEITCITKTNK